MEARNRKGESFNKALAFRGTVRSTWPVQSRAKELKPAAIAARLEKKLKGLGELFLEIEASDCESPCSILGLRRRAEDLTTDGTDATDKNLNS